MGGFILSMLFAGVLWEMFKASVHVGTRYSAWRQDRMFWRKYMGTANFFQYYDCLAPFSRVRKS